MADDGKKRNALQDYAKAESMMQLAFSLPIGCLIGWLLGVGADHLFHTDWIYIPGVLLGAAAGFMQIFTTASRYLKRSE